MVSSEHEMLRCSVESEPSRLQGGRDVSSDNIHGRGCCGGVRRVVICGLTVLAAVGGVIIGIGTYTMASAGPVCSQAVSASAVRGRQLDDDDESKTQIEKEADELSHWWDAHLRKGILGSLLMQPTVREPNCNIESKEYFAMRTVYGPVSRAIDGLVSNQMPLEEFFEFMMVQQAADVRICFQETRKTKEEPFCGKCLNFRNPTLREFGPESDRSLIALDIYGYPNEEKKEVLPDAGLLPQVAEQELAKNTVEMEKWWGQHPKKGIQSMTLSKTDYANNANTIRLVKKAEDFGLDKVGWKEGIRLGYVRKAIQEVLANPPEKVMTLKKFLEYMRVDHKADVKICFQEPRKTKEEKSDKKCLDFPVLANTDLVKRREVILQIYGWPNGKEGQGQVTDAEVAGQKPKEVANWDSKW